MTKTIRVQDDLGRTLTWQAPPTRIISLVPSDTYSLIRLGAAGRLVGRTRYCVAPEQAVASIETVGGTKDCDVDRIVELAPDLVVANQEENSRAHIMRLHAAGLQVLVSFPQTVSAGLAHLARLARALGVEADADTRALIAWAYGTHEAARARRQERPAVRVFVPIWMDPLMTVQQDTFISDVLDLAGAHNVFADRLRRYPLAADLGQAAALPEERVGERDVRYPRVTLEEVVLRAPEVVLLPDEPHPFTEADAEVFRTLPIPAARAGRVLFCDGKDLMWYGARSLEGVDRLRALVHDGGSGRFRS
jgi:ABC-type Fe3+-hydroxamate transport system substrate-binding protein